MAPYLIITGIVTILTYVGSKYDKHGNRVLAFIPYVAAVLILCNFAAQRDITVGTDTVNYLTDYVYIIDKDFSIIYTEGTHLDRMETLYKVVLWFTANVLHSSYYFFFIMALITVGTLFVALRLIDIDCMPLGIFFFSIFFFPMSFNVMRQYCAMSLTLLSYVFIRDKKLIPLILCSFIAYGFHNSSAICPVIIFIFVRLGHSDGKYKQLKIFCSIVAIALGVLVLPQLLPSLLNDDNPYAHYLNTVTMKGGGLKRDFAEMFVFFSGLSLLNVLLTHNTNDKKSLDTTPLFLMAMLGVVSYGLCIYSKWFYRISLYFLYFLIPLLPVASNNISLKQDRTIYKAICVILILVFCYGYFISRGHDEIIPYIKTAIYY